MVWVVLWVGVQVELVAQINTTVKLLLATNNQGKLSEMRAILSSLQVEVLSPEDVGVSKDFDVEETGTTFAENAELKARTFAQETGLLAVADDSGLSVVALNGEPGVYSKRFVSGSDSDRNQEILRRLGNEKNRAAFFTSILCLYDPIQKKALCFEGKVHGDIGFMEAGNKGFGYDPIFVPKGYTKTLAELGSEVKNTISHRAKSIQKLKKHLQKND